MINRSLKIYYGKKYEQYKEEKSKQIGTSNQRFLKNTPMSNPKTKKEVSESPFFKYLPHSKNRLLTYLEALGIIALCTSICFLLYPHLKDSNLIMVYLLGIAVVALFGQIGPSIFASILSVFMYDFFFVPPFFSLSVLDIQSLFTLIVMMLVGQLISILTIHGQRQIEVTRKAQMEMEEERFRNILLSSISHDLRTPLTAIIGSASSLLQSGQKLNEESKRELAQNIYDESERLNSLVNNILKIIRIESGLIRMTKQSHALEEVIGIALNKLEKQLANRPVLIEIPKHTPLIPFDNTLIGQVLINLIENAIKHTPQDSPIEISADFKVHHAIIKVADRGPGIDPKEIDKIFDKFYQGQKSDTKGIGLGLAICKGIIHAHKGEIWAEARNKGGAIFCFTLPLG